MVDIKKVFKGDSVKSNLESKNYELTLDTRYEVVSVNPIYDTVMVVNDIGAAVPVHSHWFKDHESAFNLLEDGWDIPVGSGDCLPTKFLHQLVNEEFPSAFETQVKDNHYKTKGIQPLQYIVANNLDFNQGNVIKYVTRYKDKNGAEDLKKAMHYLRFLLECNYEIRSKVEYSDD